MGFCKRCGDLVHGTNCLKCGGRAVSSATSGLAATGTRNDPWMSMYQNILEGGSTPKTAKRMSLPAITTAPKPQPLITQKVCNGCSKQIHQAKVFVEPSRPTVIYCEKCYVERFTKGNCPTCYRPVMSKTDIFVTYDQRSWHKNCFVCFNCRKDVSSNPMVDLRKRPCCEACLMAQAGSARTPLSDRSTEAMHSASAISPEPSVPSSPSPTSTISSSSGTVSSSANMAAHLHPLDATDAHRLHLHLSPLDINADAHHTMDPYLRSSPSSLSRLSSTSSNYRQQGAPGDMLHGPSHDYAYGTPATYSGLGRRQAESYATESANPSARIGNNSASLFVKDETYPASSFGNGSNTGWRSSSSLSNHSHHTSRASSPFQSHAYTGGGDHHHHYHHHHGRPASPMGKDVGQPKLYRTRSRSFGGHGSALDSRSSSPSSVRSSVTSSSGLYRSDSQVTTVTNASSADDAATTGHPHSRPTTPLQYKTGLYDRESTVVEDREQPLHPRPEDPKVARNAYKEQQVPPRPELQRSRSRSFAATTDKAGLIRARTEALMAANVSAASLPPISPVIGPTRSSKFFNTSSNLTIANAAVHGSASSVLNRPASPAMKTGVSKPDAPAETTTTTSAKLAPAMEIERPSLYRHGRQRSNTVGEAVTFPAVSVTSNPSSPTQQRRSSVQPDSGSCLKCFEKVVENGVKLPNGDRYHIQCFLCNGCKQIFTESEFHIVNGRPYHPQCSSLAGSTSTMSATTKCAKCLKLISKRTIRFGGLNFHPQCFTCSHCHQVLLSTSKFFEVDGKVECERCCEEKDKQRLPQMVPLPRSTEPSFPTAGSPLARRQSQYLSGIASPTAAAFDAARPEAGGQESQSGASTPRMHRSGSPTGSPGRDAAFGQGGSMVMAQEYRSQSPITVAAAAPMAPVADPPVLTSLFSTRTRPLPKFGGTITCPRCKQPIGVMEQTPGPRGDKWHKKCLNCKGCKKVLDSSALTLGEGEAFCRACYNKATKA